MVSLDLVSKPYSPALLAQIKNYTPALCFDEFHRVLKLISAVAADATQSVSGKAFRVNSRKHRSAVGDVAFYQCNMLKTVKLVAENFNLEFPAPARRKDCVGDLLDQ